VELAETAKHCPLCHAPVQQAQPVQPTESTQPPQTSEPGPAASAYPELAIDVDQFERLTEPQKRKVFLELSAVLSIIACLTVLAVELLIERRVGWSLYPVASIAYLYVIVAVPVAMRGRGWTAAWAVAIATPLYLLALDLFDPSSSWFPAIGAPIVAVVEATVMACAALISRMGRRGLNAIGVALVGASAVCIGVEIVLDAARGRPVYPEWSAIVAITCLPIAGALAYLHYRVMRRASLKKLFHL